MAKVEIYTWRTCPFCIRAKALLDGKGAAYTEISVDGDDMRVTIDEISEGEEAGIKSATIEVEGRDAYG